MTYDPGNADSVSPKSRSTLGVTGIKIRRPDSVCPQREAKTQLGSGPFFKMMKSFLSEQPLRSAVYVSFRSMFFNVFDKFFNRILTLVWYYVRPILKRFLRRTTGLCELQRICYRTDSGAKRALNVEKSIESSNSRVIKKIRDKLDQLSQEGKFNLENKNEVVKLIEFAIEGICVEKAVKPEIHQEFLVDLRICFLQIYGYKQLLYEVNQLREAAYDSHDESHERRLLTLWSYLMPGVELSARTSRQWTQIGFQGDDPKTDFRGMGMLGLENLLYLSRNYTECARQILLHSNHPSHGFPFAITGINITYIAFTLLKNGKLKTHFYNTFFSTVCIEDFHKVYCYLFMAFDRLWLKEKPTDVMEFRFIKEKFVADVEEQLDDLTTTLKCEALVEII